ncbi:MAG: lipoyl(octanoyl) transferase LipB [Thermodesulfobacteriota bacterium]
MRASCLTVEIGLSEFGRAWQLQRHLWQDRVDGKLDDLLILTEHHPTYTVGRGGGENHLLVNEEQLREKGVTLYRIDRGGDITYHGPGQLVGYPILDLTALYRDIHRYLRELERALMMTMADFGLEARQIPGLTGVWVKERKLASIGIRVSRWVTMHGFALNVSTDMDFFRDIIPCGIWGKEMTSMTELLGIEPPLHQVAERFTINFGEVFGREMIKVAVDDLVGVHPEESANVS